MFEMHLKAYTAQCIGGASKAMYKQVSGWSAASHLSLAVVVWLLGLRISFWCSCLSLYQRGVWRAL